MKILIRRWDNGMKAGDPLRCEGALYWEADNFFLDGGKAEIEKLSEDEAMTWIAMAWIYETGKEKFFPGITKEA